MSYGKQCLARLLVIGMFALIAPAASAAPCAGFADVDSSSPFCASLTWVRNQGVTVGCGDGTNYCPNDPVSRLGMAAFLKRMADATGDAATAQPYAFTMTPTCTAGNTCSALFPTVPAGKRLRLTGVRLVYRGLDANAILAVHRNLALASNLLLAFQVTPFAASHYGFILSSNESVDLTFIAGETPVLEIAIESGAGALSPFFAKLGVAGYLVDVTP